METWTKIKRIKKPGYFVSDQGRIKVIKPSGEVIKLGSRTPSGYMVLSWGKNDHTMVHILVLENFIERPDWAECVNHKNGIKHDNRLENLEWSTIKLNNLHAFANKLNTVVGANGEDHHLSRDIEQVVDIYRLKKAGFRACEVGRIMGTKGSKINRIYHGIDWSYLYKKFFNN